MKVLEKMKKQIIVSLFVCLCMLASPVANYASVPQLMSYQGLLKDAQGNYLTGTYNMVFRIYDVVTGGTVLWSETQSGVSATSGRFNVELGSVSALNLPFNTQYWLSIQVGSDPEMSPRVKLTSAGYAYNSENVVNSFTESSHDNKSHMDVEGVKSNTTNIAKTNFKLDAYSSASANNMGDMVVDVFKDESGIDTANSTHYLWQGSPNYSVTTQPATGGIDSNAKLVLHSNGTNNSTTFTDSASGGKTPTIYGNAKLSTSYQKFGTASANFSDIGYLEYPSSSDWNVGTGDYTIDFWVMWPTSTYQNQYLCSMNNGANSIAITVNTGANYLAMYVNGDCPVWYYFTPTPGTWYHVAAVRSGTDCYLFINGTSVYTAGSRTSSGNVSSTYPFRVGTWDGTYYNFTGYIDEFRFTKGLARWTSNFTPPTAEYAAPGNPDPATVISTPFSETTAPGEAMVIGDEALNGGTISYYVSRDNGTTWTQASNGNVVSLGAQPSGTQIRWKAGITGTAELKGLAVALS